MSTSKKKTVDTEDLALFRTLLHQEMDAKFGESSSVFNAQTHFDFPSVGKVNVIYKAESERKIYQWNPNDLKYEPINASSSLDIKLIDGGNANG